MRKTFAFVLFVILSTQAFGAVASRTSYYEFAGHTEGLEAKCEAEAVRVNKQLEKIASGFGLENMVRASSEIIKTSISSIAYDDLKVDTCKITLESDDLGFGFVRVVESLKLGRGEDQRACDSIIARNNRSDDLVVQKLISKNELFKRSCEVHSFRLVMR